jgi:Amt family ammonium transporter
MEWLKQGKASILGACSGAVAGLVCITPASGSVTPVNGIIMGFIAGAFCYLCCTKMKNSLGYDDSLDAFGVHGMGGTLGALLTGLFATQLVTGGTEPAGFFDGNKGQLMVQAVSVAAAVGFSAVGTFILLKIIDPIMGLRVSEEEEVQGLDISQHGEEGYIFQ